jgi:hypothetical protein
MNALVTSAIRGTLSVMNDLTVSCLAIHGSMKMKNSLAEQHIIVMLTEASMIIVI